MSWPGNKGCNPLDTQAAISLEGPESLPWIFNTVHLEVRGAVMGIGWGPHHQEPLQGMYYEVSMFGNVIWATSPSMSKEVRGRECQPGRYVFNNTQLPILVTESTVYPNPPHQYCTIPARPGRQVKLRIHGHPLYT
ncbi:hypothetical protein ILYODFUR_035513 [Ilyodon furcidens]|uniref:Uncharacterized protein n=1 Tax=Ilyodon furcidens TaxID=33524 RepID=A0ABV0STI6_9TELE